MNIDKLTLIVERMRNRHERLNGYWRGNGELRFLNLFLSFLRTDEPIPHEELTDLLDEALVTWKASSDCLNSDVIILVCRWVKAIRPEFELGEEHKRFYRHGAYDGMDGFLDQLFLGQGVLPE